MNYTNAWGFCLSGTLGYKVLDILKELCYDSVSIYLTVKVITMKLNYKSEKMRASYEDFSKSGLTDKKLWVKFNKQDEENPKLAYAYDEVHLLREQGKANTPEMTMARLTLRKLQHQNQLDNGYYSDMDYNEDIMECYNSSLAEIAKLEAEVADMN